MIPQSFTMRLRSWYCLAGATISLGWLISASDEHRANAREFAGSLPRGWRAFVWALNAGRDYYSLQDFPQNVNASLVHGVHETWADRLLDLCLENKGVYVKAGQLLSTIGAVPYEYRERLSKLHDQCNPKPFSIVSKVIEQELGMPWTSVFDQLESQPTAAASVAQVHQGYLKTGEKVAVKVQYPGLESAMAADLSFLSFFSRLAAWFFPSYELGWVFDELKVRLGKEMDFTLEAVNAEALAVKLKHRTDVRVPRMHNKHCTSKMLIMEWIDGCKLLDKNCIVQEGMNPRSVALKLLDVFSEMTLVHGFIHGDPHPGNVLVVPIKLWDGPFFSSLVKNIWRIFSLKWWQPFEIVLLDHGRYLEVETETRIQYCTLWAHLIRGDTDSAVETARKLCHTSVGGELLPRILQRRMTREERKSLHSDAGLDGFSGIISLLHGTPQPLVDSLRITGVVRHVASRLADIHMDRVCIEGSNACVGLKQSRISEESFVGWGTGLRIFVLKAGLWMRSIMFSLELYRNINRCLYSREFVTKSVDCQETFNTSP
ncbi:hypothetical protein BSKO_09851 [Bryopsis sp. KO-2023]|nr:hypothetical protein BSKO_09851 [Bryopsis sp. KO-2023]